MMMMMSHHMMVSWRERENTDYIAAPVLLYWSGIATAVLTVLFKVICELLNTASAVDMLHNSATISSD